MLDQYNRVITNVILRESAFGETTEESLLFMRRFFPPTGVRMTNDLSIEFIPELFSCKYHLQNQFILPFGIRMLHSQNHFVLADFFKRLFKQGIMPV